nr:MAG TPA: hypothetical protein [Caudoviricetes sp.]
MTPQSAVDELHTTIFWLINGAFNSVVMFTDLRTEVCSRFVFEYKTKVCCGGTQHGGDVFTTTLDLLRCRPRPTSK